MSKLVIPWNELEFSYTRSSGAGGQHINKTNSAVQLRFNVATSTALSEQQKHRILTKLSHKIVQGECLLIRAEEERDQKRNKDQAYKSLIRMLEFALKEPKKRIPTKVKKSAVQKRLAEKKTRSEVKSNRSKKIDWS